MIDPNFKFIDIHPYTWRNLGEVMDILMPIKNVLFILHSKGHFISACDDCKKTYRFTDDFIQNFCLNYEHFFYDNPQIDEIHIIDKESLIKYYCTIQDTCLDEKNSFEYMNFITKLYPDFKGIDVYTRSGESTQFYEKALNLIKHRKIHDLVYIFIILKENVIWFDVLLDFDGEKVTTITTLECLRDKSVYSTSNIDLEEIEKKISKKFAKKTMLKIINKSDLIKLKNFWISYKL